jgi:hypothetical protein
MASHPKGTRTVMPRQAHMSGGRTPARAGAERSWYLSWRAAEEWERPVIDRAYAASAAAAAVLVRVAGR